MNARGAGRDDDAFSGGIPPGPVSHELAGKGYARNFDRLIGICNVQCADTVNGGIALVEVVADDGRDAARTSRKLMNERGFGMFRRDAGYVFEATGSGLDEVRGVGSATRFFGISVAGQLRTRLEQAGMEQLEIGESPDLMAAA